MKKKIKINYFENINSVECVSKYKLKQTFLSLAEFNSILSSNTVSFRPEQLSSASCILMCMKFEKYCYIYRETDHILCLISLNFVLFMFISCRELLTQFIQFDD